MAKNYKNKNLGIVQIAASLVSLHYGLGFLLGTSEMVYKQGINGMVYGLTCAIGLLFLTFLIPFYWRNKKPIWDLFENKYGKKVKNGTIFLSWFWMIGVTTSQILGGAYIVKMFNVSLINSLIIVIILTTILSLLPLEKLSKFLLFLLLSWIRQDRPPFFRFYFLFGIFMVAVTYIFKSIYNLLICYIFIFS